MVPKQAAREDACVAKCRRGDELRWQLEACGGMRDCGAVLLVSAHGLRVHSCGGSYGARAARVRRGSKSHA